MLIASSLLTIGQASVRSTVMLAQRLRIHFIERTHLVFDSRFAAAATGRPHDVVHLYLIRHGDVAVRGFAPRVGPVGLALADDEFDYIDPATATTFRNHGARSSAFILRVPRADCLVPVGLARGALRLGDAVWVAVDRIDATGSTEAIASGAAAVLTQLAADGVVTRELATSAQTPDADDMQRLWAGIAPLYRDFATSATITQLEETTGLSRRQVGRDLSQLLLQYGLLGDVFRDASRVLRLRAATLLLSAPDTTATAVAAAVGYASIDAMGRAFRDANLPPPSDVRAALLAIE